MSHLYFVSTGKYLKIELPGTGAGTHESLCTYRLKRSTNDWRMRNFQVRGWRGQWNVPCICEIPTPSSFTNKIQNCFLYFVWKISFYTFKHPHFGERNCYAGGIIIYQSINKMEFLFHQIYDDASRVKALLRTGDWLMLI